MASNSLINIRQNAISDLVRNSISKIEASLEVDILIQHVFGISKKDILINPDKDISENKMQEFYDLLNKRILQKMPIQYLTSSAYFMEYKFYVDKNVLIPRPETEILVEQVLNISKKINPSRILDIGTGSGCIACVLAKYLQDVSLVACDISEQALNIAKINAKKLEVISNIDFLLSDIFSKVKGAFDIIVSNPPYIPIKEKAAIQPEVIRNEPHLALFADDENGIYFYKKIIEESKAYLRKGGYLAFEIGINQAPLILSILDKEKYSEVFIIKDYSNIERIITAKF